MNDITKIDAFLQSSPHPAWLATSRNECLYINPALERLTGLRSDQINQVDWRSFVLDEDQAAASASWQRSLASGTPYCSMRTLSNEHDNGSFLSAIDMHMPDQRSWFRQGGGVELKGIKPTFLATKGKRDTRYIRTRKAVATIINEPAIAYCQWRIGSANLSLG